jgi:uncharacterized protein (TIGR02147 family)
MNNFKDFSLKKRRARPPFSPVAGNAESLKDYRELLRSEYLKRRRRDPAYSLTHFSAHLGLSRPFTSQLLNFRTHLSLARARTVISKLRWPLNEKKYFLSLVEATVSKYKPQRDAALERIRLQSPRKTLPGAALNTLTWKHFALLELVKTESYKMAPSSQSEGIGLLGDNLTKAFQELEAFGLVEKTSDGHYVQAVNDSEILSPRENDQVQRFHTELIEQAPKAFAKSTAQDRHFESLILAFDKQQLPEVKRVLYEFIRQFNERFSMGHRNSVYALLTQFFSLDGK